MVAHTRAAGVDLVGPSNLVTLIRSIPPYWAPMRALLPKRMGDPDVDEPFLQSRSPLFFASRIQAPLLIGQGANDPRVPQRESEQIVQALRAAGKPVEYIVYQDEGHGFSSRRAAGPAACIPDATMVAPRRLAALPALPYWRADVRRGPAH